MAVSDRHADNALRYEDSGGYIRAVRGTLTSGVFATTPVVAGSMPAGGTGATAGGWSGSADRNTAITTITEMKTQLNAWLAVLRAAGYTAVIDVAGAIPAGGVGAAVGAYDTAANRDIAIATWTELKSQINAGLLEARLKGYPAVADVAGVIPAGGTGADAGAYDTAANRNTTITTSTEIKTQLNALLADLRAKGYVG